MSDLYYEIPEWLLDTFIVFAFDFPVIADAVFWNGFCRLSTPDFPGTAAAS